VDIFAKNETSREKYDNIKHDLTLPLMTAIKKCKLN